MKARDNGGPSSSSKRTDAWKPLGACSSLLRPVRQTDSCRCPQSLLCLLVKAERHRSLEKASKEKARALSRTGRTPGRNRAAKAWGEEKQGAFSGTVSGSSFDKSPVAYSY